MLTRETSLLKLTAVISLIAGPESNCIASVVKHSGKQLVLVVGLKGAAEGAEYDGISANGVVFGPSCDYVHMQLSAGARGWS